MSNSWLTKAELASQFKGRVHPSALVSRHARFYGYEVKIGQNSRVDDFCLLSGRVTIGAYVHIAAYGAIFGSEEGVSFGDHASMGAFGLVLTESDALDGSALSGPTVPEYARNVKSAPIIIASFAALAARVTVLPGGGLCAGAVAGAHSLVTSVLPEWTINVGTPAKLLRPRERDRMETLATLVQMGHRDGGTH